MDIQQIAEKLFNFCKEKYPDLNWNLDSENNIIQCPVFPYELIIDVFADGLLKRVLCSAYCVGSFEIWINPRDRNNNCPYENKIADEIVKAISNFIKTEIQF